MASFYFSKVAEFLSCPVEQVLAGLAAGYAGAGFVTQYTDQTLTWKRDLNSLRSTLEVCCQASEAAKNWGLLLEFSIPRKETRIDVVLLACETIVVLETKTAKPDRSAYRQLEEYVLLLHYFHKASQNRKIKPVLVSPAFGDKPYPSIEQREMFPQLAAYWIAPIAELSWEGIAPALLAMVSGQAGQISVDVWNDSPYFPVPGILEAAVALRTGLSIREIAHSEAAESEIESIQTEIHEHLLHAKRDRHHAICFLTGVPGSGKTLVGLSLAHSDFSKSEPMHFMSGNGPLVKVLQHLFTQEAQARGIAAPQARTHARTLLENVHVFASYYTEENLGAPSNRAIIFDEAQRAWNRDQNYRKFKRDYSEPEMLLRIMERHEDWAIVVALVGGGQEINDGEAGLEEWGRALKNASKQWRVYASPEVISGGASTAGHRLFSIQSNENNRITTSSALHLRTSNRSLRAEHLADWVNLVLDGDAAGANAVGITNRFPIFLSRSLEMVRRELRKNTRGNARCGLVGSSGAARLRAVGLEPDSSFHAEYPWEHWYLSGESDVRSSYQCEVFATEFEIQGLELDWIGLCWGGDFIWSEPVGWQLRRLRHAGETRWSPLKNEFKRTYRRNAYRVLLTRARQGMIIYVPPGDPSDPTNQPEEMDSTATFLSNCGVILLPPESRC